MQTGTTVWITGLPAAGKTTLATTAAAMLQRRGLAVQVLDGDQLRRTVSADLGFSREDRAEQSRRAASLALEAGQGGAVALVALVSPYAADRAAARSLHVRTGIPFLEVFLDVDVAECERRDPKGLYAAARAGELKGLTGVDGPYEPPVDPELRISAAESPEAAAARLVELVSRSGERSLSAPG